MHACILTRTTLMTPISGTISVSNTGSAVQQALLDLQPRILSSLGSSEEPGAGLVCPGS